MSLQVKEWQDAWEERDKDFEKQGINKQGTCVSLSLGLFFFYQLQFSRKHTKFMIYMAIWLIILVITYKKQNYAFEINAYACVNSSNPQIHFGAS